MVEGATVIEPILEVNGLSVSYGEKQILKNVGFKLGEGKILVIAGESGSGKSTVLKAVHGLLGTGGMITGGEILLEGRNITKLSMGERRKLSGEKLSMVFQNAGASFCPVRTIGAQIFEAVRAHRDWSYKEFRSKAVYVMKQINLEEAVLDKYPFQLSGGMCQRAGILAAVILAPKLLLADEPTSALDSVTQLSVVKTLMGLRDHQGISMIIVTHHMGVAWYMADHILIMCRGQAVEYGSREDIFYRPGESYTRELIAAVPGIKRKIFQGAV